MKIILNLSPNYSNKKRNKKNIKYVIIHYTGMQSEVESIAWLKNKKSKVSCHYLINRKGQVFQMVKDNHIAWHAGKSKWSKYINLNKVSLGIELVNKGHQYGYQNFSVKQIKSLIKLCKNLKNKYAIRKENFIGHSDIAPLRKTDPGEKFPWQKLSTHNLGKWFMKDLVVSKNLFSKETRLLFFKNLYKLGYRYFNIYSESSNDRLIIKSFQRKYLPNNITGKIDKKTLKISHFLTLKT